MRSDAELVTAFAAGEREAYGLLAERHKAAVYAVCLAMVGRVHDAQDLTQDAFVRGMRNMGGLQEAGRFGGWIMQIARNLCRDWLKRRRELADAFELESLPIRQSRERDMEMREVVRDAIGRLGEMQREVVLLFYISELSGEEIAQRLGVPAGTVRRRLHEARRQLREELETMEKESMRAGVPSDDFGKRVLEGVTVCAGSWRMEGDELSGMAWPEKSAWRPEMSRVITRNSYPGDRLVVEFDACCFTGWEGGLAQCFFTPYGSVEAIDSAGMDERMPVFALPFTSSGRHRYARIAEHFVRVGSEHWSRQTLRYADTSDLCPRHDKWYHIKCERLGTLLRLSVDGVAIGEIQTELPAPEKVYVMLSADVAHSHFRNLKITVPDEAYLRRNGKPGDVFGPYHRTMAILAKYPETILREAKIDMGNEAAAQQLKVIPDRSGQLAPVEEVLGRRVRRTQVADKQRMIHFELEDSGRWRQGYVRLEVEHLDAGFDSWFALYNSWYHSAATSPDVVAGNTGQWKWARLWLRDAKFVPWAGMCGGQLLVGPNRGGDLKIAGVRLVEVSWPAEAWNEVLQAMQEQIERAKTHKHDWVIPHYMLAASEALYKLGRGNEGWALETRTLEEYPRSEINETWARTHRTGDW